jgi:signal transduction histidine kinase
MAGCHHGRILHHREGLIGSLVALALVATSLVGAATMAHVRDQQRRTAAGADLAAALARVQADVAATVDDARRSAGSVSAAGRFVPSLVTRNGPVSAQAAFVRAVGETYTADAASGLDAVALGQAGSTLAAARDTGLARVTPSLGTTGARRVYAVAAAFGPMAAGASFGTTAERRETLLGFVFVEVDMGSLAARAETGDASIVLSIGGMAFGGPHPGHRLITARAPISIAEQPFAVEAAATVPSTPPAGAAALVLVAAIVGVGLFALAVGAGRRRREAEELAATRLGQLRLMTTLAPVVQETMDLGQILPVVATRLRDELGLAGISFAVRNAAGHTRDVFALGSVDQTPATREIPATIAGGESLTLALHRGARSAGELRLKAGRLLSSADLEPVRAVAELTTAAIVNAQLFEQQDTAMRKLRELDELKTVFLGTASHELRTPVTAISGFASLLDTQWDSLSEEQHRQFAQRIADNSRALESLVQDLLDFAGMERGRVAVINEPIDIALVISAVLARLTEAFPGHTLASELESTTTVLADRNALERVVTNLVSNAVKYSPAGSTVTVRTESTDDGAVLIVDDEGPGVPPAERDRIFSRFFRGTSAAVVRTRGTGIGLSVVKEFLDKMGGTIEVGTAPSGGARFRVFLRAARVDQEAAG